MFVVRAKIKEWKLSKDLSNVVRTITRAVVYIYRVFSHFTRILVTCIFASEVVFPKYSEKLQTNRIDGTRTSRPKMQVHERTTR